MKGIFAPEVVPEGWFDETIKPVGWFSQDFLDTAASGDATANGATLTEAISLISGTATGVRNATASGQVIQFATSLVPGTATGQRNATAAGATVVELFSFTPGSASGQADATATGQTLAHVYSLVPGEASATGTVPRARGDDGGARERFWRAKAEEWLEDQLEAVKRAARGPRRARRRLATRIVADVPEFVSAIPEFAPRIDALERLGKRLEAPEVDYTAIAQAIAAQMALFEAWNTKQRRRRDMEALLILAA